MNNKLMNNKKIIVLSFIFLIYKMKKKSFGPQHCHKIYCFGLKIKVCLFFCSFPDNKNGTRG